MSPCSAGVWTNPGEPLPRDGIDNDDNGLTDDIYGWNFFDDVPWLYFDQYEDYHGTHIAGIIAAVGDNGEGVAGLNWQAQLMSLKFIGPFGYGQISDAILAIQYATANGAQVINASWGVAEFSQALKDAIVACNCVFVAAAGNGGSDNIGDDIDFVPHYPASYDLPNIISVAATDHDNQKASFSNFGARSVDLGAPGVDILSTLPPNYYGVLSGTSAATPHVAGVAGLLLSQFPGLTPAQVRTRIIGTTDPILSLAGITVSGGRLNAYRALTETPAPLPSPPPVNVANADVSTPFRNAERQFRQHPAAGQRLRVYH